MRQHDLMFTGSLIAYRHGKNCNYNQVYCTSAHCTLGCFKIAPLSNFLTAQQISDGVLAADYEFDIIF